MNVDDLYEIVHDAYDNKGKSIEFFSHIDSIVSHLQFDKYHVSYHDSFIVVALFHDVLEAGLMCEDYVRELTSNEEYDAIVMLTRRRDELYADYINRIQGKLACTVKLYDVMNNLMRCMSDKNFKRAKRYSHVVSTMLDKLQTIKGGEKD